MTDQTDHFPVQDPTQLLQNPQIQKLMEKLQHMDPEMLQNAVSLVSNGSISQAQNLLSPILQDEDVKKLMQEMRDPNG